MPPGPALALALVLPPMPAAWVPLPDDIAAWPPAPALPALCCTPTSEPHAAISAAAENPNVHSSTRSLIGPAYAIDGGSVSPSRSARPGMVSPPGTLGREAFDDGRHEQALHAGHDRGPIPPLRRAPRARAGRQGGAHRLLAAEPL